MQMHEPEVSRDVERLIEDRRLDAEHMARALSADDIVDAPGYALAQARREAHAAAERWVAARCAGAFFVTFMFSTGIVIARGLRNDPWIGVETLGCAAALAAIGYALRPGGMIRRMLVRWRVRATEASLGPGRQSA